jgi:pyruvate formate lyase activating enzyme
VLALRIGGFQKTSLLDYPGKISCVVFTAGCNFRCPACYVPGLVLPERIERESRIQEEAIFEYLDGKKGFIDAVVVSGGECTIQKDLPDFVKRVKERGFLVGLETQGTNFPMLEMLVKERLVDYVAMDIKNELDYEKYNRTAGRVITEEMFENVKKSINMLMESGIDYEFRTTVTMEFHTPEGLKRIAESIKGAKAYFLQNYRYTEDHVGNTKLTELSDDELKKARDLCNEFVPTKIR